MKLKPDELKEFLDFKYDLYDRQPFITSDPILIPHQFVKKEDIEIAGFLVATIAWGQRKTIIDNGYKLMQMMGNTPYEFVMEASSLEQKHLSRFVHRTFNQEDLVFFFQALHQIYKYHGGMQLVFENAYRQQGSLKMAIQAFRRLFLSLQPGHRAAKHISDIERGAAGKRLNMFLRWMVRRDIRKVDFGIWNGIPMSALYLPLDLHTGNVSRKLGLLSRKQSDWKAVEEVTSQLKILDPEDPIKYDYALFGLGIFEKF